MSTPVTGMRIDPDLKEQAAKLFEEQGLSFSEDVKCLLEEMVSKGRLELALERTPRPDYISEYLEPIRNQRFEKPRSIGRSPSWLRGRLRTRREAL